MIPQLHQTFEMVRAARELVSADDYVVRLLIDTNALIDNPDVAAYPARSVAATWCMCLRWPSVNSMI